MAVSSQGQTGTIGGGRLEWDAAQTARAMLARTMPTRGASPIEEVIALGPALGQCCGGRVTLSYEPLTPALYHELGQAADKAAALRPAVFIYGAGHVGRALAQALAPLPIATTLLDSRAEELSQTQASGVTLLAQENLAAWAETAPAHAAHVVMTHSHALDSLIAATVLERGDFAYLGLIGSATKRAAFFSAFRDMGFTDAQLARLTCPIGGFAVADKRPEVIAALTAAEILSKVLGNGG